ncbi:MAG TPA: hypothetical protein VMB20_02775 [Candidatus Acidoferrum sp.]|nr:hypothetical protein [Candidatus Acidoferrum sp.]
MKGMLVFKSVSDARSEGFDVYDDLEGDYIVVSKATSSGRAFAIALREPCHC